jgi:hypothetical protein
MLLNVCYLHEPTLSKLVRHTLHRWMEAIPPPDPVLLPVAARGVRVPANHKRKHLCSFLNSVRLCSNGELILCAIIDIVDSGQMGIHLNDNVSRYLCRVARHECGGGLAFR